LSWGEYIDYDLEGHESEPILEGGYQNLVKFLVKSLDGLANVHLNQTVRKILWSEEEGKVCTEDGKIYTADFVVVALPLGVLKQESQELFDPALPINKLEIIERLGFGVMNKIFLHFDSIFWDQDNPGIQLVKTDVDYEENEDLFDTWQNHIAGFDSVCGQPNVLCGWIAGDPARVMENLSDEEIKERCWNLLRKYVNVNVPPPSRCKVSRWGSNQLSRGSYSYRPPACDELSIGPWTLSAPVLDTEGRTRLLFAGEASDTDHYGTVTGAMMSGIREADRIARIMKGQGGAGRE